MKEMAKLLRTGATMLSQSCPVCGSPLFKLKSGDTFCAKCQRKVVIVEEGEETTTEAGIMLESLERTIIKKISFLEGVLSSEEEPVKLKNVVDVIDALLESLQKLRSVKKR